MCAEPYFWRRLREEQRCVWVSVGKTSSFVFCFLVIHSDKAAMLMRLRFLRSEPIFTELWNREAAGSSSRPTHTKLWGEIELWQDMHGGEIFTVMTPLLKPHHFPCKSISYAVIYNVSVYISVKIVIHKAHVCVIADKTMQAGKAERRLMVCDRWKVTGPD